MKSSTTRESELDTTKTNNDLKKSEPVSQNLMTLYLWAGGISLGAFVMGYFFVIVSVLTSTITHFNKQSGDNLTMLLSVCTACLPLGGLLGSLLYSRISSIVKSQNRLMVITDICMIILVTVQAFSLNIYLYTVIRFFQGFIVGIYGNVIPPYLISISPTKVSGRIGSFNQIMITIGIAVAYAMGYLIDNQNLSSSFNWRVCVLLPVPICIARIIVCNYFPYDCLETHINRRDWLSLFQYLQLFYQKNTFSLKQLIRSKNIDISKIKQQIPNSRENYKNNAEGGKKQVESQAQLKQIEETDKKSISVVRSTGSSVRKAVAIAICIMNQFCGINAILFYSNQLFLDISSGNVDYAVKKSLELGVFQIIVTIISGAIMDKFGRRSLMICGQIMIIIALVSGYVMIGSTGDSKWDPETVSYAIFLHMAGFSLSLGPITVVYISEIVQNISPYMTFIWIQTILISLASNILIQKFGTGKIFLFFGIISTFGLIFVFKYMLQTKGKTKQQIFRNFDGLDADQVKKCIDNIIEEDKNYNQVQMSQN